MKFLDNNITHVVIIFIIHYYLLHSLTLSLYIYYYKTENYLRIIVNSSRSPSSRLQQRQQCLVHIQSSILACQTLTLSLSLTYSLIYLIVLSYYII